jgi:hypothetical protein
MTPNPSLQLSLEFKKLIRQDMLQQISSEFPFFLVEASSRAAGGRDRVYNPENTLLTMLITAFGEDKSLQQSVSIFKQVFESRCLNMAEKEVHLIEQLRKDSLSAVQQAGRPRLFKSKMPKSKSNSVSANTAAYTKARQRLNAGLVNEVFRYSADLGSVNPALWFGMKVYNTDGTYIQLQDSEELKKKYQVIERNGAYPQALVQAIVMQGSGQICFFKIGTRHDSELALVSALADELPPNSLLLADDLYNSYAIFALVLQKGCHIMVPGKRNRNYKVLTTLGNGDEIVELKRTQKPDWWKEQWKLPEKIVLRRMTYLSPIDGEKICVLYTTITNEKISKTDLIIKYKDRWDIEITIREVKTLMDINVARSKSGEMVLKEIAVAFTAYNMARKIIARSVEKTGFSPQENILQEFSEIDKNIHIDKKGRIYKHWSPGRYGKTATANM